ncbi:hypothetical protein ONZ45_g1647 [Pleurotus djamor]|nr:hypothetical protein ONZ45_g1647 [Pleurotus djamor]
MSSKGVNSSTTSLQSTDTTTSTTPLNQSARRKQKNFSTAFADLQQKYGASGYSYNPMAGRPAPHIDTPSSSSAGHNDQGNAKIPSTSSKPSSLSAIQENPPPPGGQKDFETAFGSLSSSYGVSNALPTLPRKDKQKQDSAKAKSFAKQLFSRKGISLRSVGIRTLLNQSTKGK